MDDAFGHWLAGFTDGEGAFTICRVSSRNGNPNNRTWPNCRYEVTLRADDSAMLVEIQRELGMGNITVHTKPNLRVPGALGAVRLTVTRIEDCVKLVEFFHRYPLRAKKRAQFLVWAEAVHEMAKGRDRSDEFIEKCRAKLAALRIFVAPDYVTVIENNPPMLRHKREYGIAPACLCGCGATTRLVAHSTGVTHPDNPNFNAFLRGHNRRLRSAM